MEEGLMTFQKKILQKETNRNYYNNKNLEN